ncbi:19531_t:CDS:2 [Racocetra persica]|uniref:19531_t:CDS:1 n=1 Tax=Racocetra persica TaxID=160502 RepID=A0ACA9KU47_9GLOM|nr:19531_t:CDS:2 [Racocetra persica]
MQQLTSPPKSTIHKHFQTKKKRSVVDQKHKSTSPNCSSEFLLSWFEDSNAIVYSNMTAIPSVQIK